MRKKTKKIYVKKVYTVNDYNSTDGMLTSVWGPPLWHFLHTISFNYPVNPSEQDKKNYKEYIFSLQNILPCKYCRINLKKNFKTLPLTHDKLKNRDTFSKYMYNLHDLINNMLGKKSNVTYQEVKNRYENFRARCTIDDNTYTKDSNKNHNGCVKPFYGKKAKCVLSFVPAETRCKTIKIDKSVLKQL